MSLSARGAASAMQGRRRQLVGGAASLDLTTGGTFTRSSAAWRQIGAPTDGSTPYMEEVAANVRRIENRGDGEGDLLLMEGSRLNIAVTNFDLGSTSWSKVVCAVSANQGNSPEGIVEADDFEPTANALARLSRAYNTGTVPANSRVVLATYARAESGTRDVRIGTVDFASAIDLTAYNIGEVYERIEHIDADVGAPGSSVMSIQPIYNDVGAGIAHVRVWGAQGEVGVPSPSSLIETPGTGTVTRAADVLTYASGQYPAEFRTDGFEFDFYPDASSTELLTIGNGNSRRLLGFVSSAHMLQLTCANAATEITLRLYESSALRVTSNVLTFSRGQKLTIRVEPSAGRITVTGATTGNGAVVGTAFTWPDGTMTIGSTPASFTFPIFGRLSLTLRGI